jgi:nudix-type nucleoside diphosphatase (YffH/AdpP family)
MSGKAVIKQQRRVFDDFFKVDELVVSFQRTDGKMSQDERRLVFERGDAVAVLLLNLDTRSVIVVQQFKVPALVGRRRDHPSIIDGWIIEAIAGVIEPNETPEAAIIRETMEETGYQIRFPKLIAKFLSSPGATSERIFLYFAEVRERDKTGKGGGIDDEDIKTLQMTLDNLFDRLAKGSIDDPKLLIAAYWLQDHVKNVDDRQQLIDAFWRSREAPGAHTSATAARSTGSAARGPLTFSTVRYELKKNKGLFVGYKTGAIDRIKDVSIWVNSENTDMMMDRFLGKSLSARIRYLGANKDENDNVVEDTIEEALRSAVGRRAHCRIGTVFVTESGQLLTTHRVKRIFHVATVQGGVAGAGFKAELSNVAPCVDKVLKRADVENNRTWRTLLGLESFQSILIPMFGSGDGGLVIEDVVRAVIPPAIEYFQYTDLPTLKEIYFLAFTARDRNACEAVLAEYVSNGTLVPTPKTADAAPDESYPARNDKVGARS